jgi:hypothetical protein
LSDEYQISEHERFAGANHDQSGLERTARRRRRKKKKKKKKNSTKYHLGLHTDELCVPCMYIVGFRLGELYPSMGFTDSKSLGRDRQMQRKRGLVIGLSRKIAMLGSIATA